MKKPGISEFGESDRFHLVESFSIDDMKQFLLRELGLTPPVEKKPFRLTVKSVLVFGIMAGLGGIVGFFLAKNAGTISWWHFPVAIGGLFLLMPIHEGIHALVFKALGAPDVGFGYSIKSLIIYAYAQRFVMSLRENALVAVMPFLVITTGLVSAWVIWPSLGLIWGTILLFHTLGCLGDYVLVRYAVKNRHRMMYTYDDLDERKSYFYERTHEPPGGPV
ncbi:hypothetical protein GCM10028803_35180 [Larkinella knui]|uniref:DUF3267 domain-containing protein n=1 Tax=Larkinella knui TaxID=2025310 RepID=A0A3P1CDL1_9BACT|nr:DUF3267 domain-containing protein [Larkinella knui]RRB11392.1 DUF3267 domain-containing protein [Larkinella knui]